MFRLFMEGLDELAKGFERLPTSSISDAMGRLNGMAGIAPIVKNLHMVGRALTVSTYLGDNMAVGVALDKYAKPGDVLVVDGHGNMEVAMFGGLMAKKCIARGVTGFVADSGVRDVDDIENLRFPVFARGVNPNSATAKFMGKINISISCGGVLVNPADIIVGDNDGVVVVPKETAEETLKNTKRIVEIEEQYAIWIEKGTVEENSELIEELSRIKTEYRSRLL